MENRIDLDWGEVQKLHDGGKTLAELGKIYSIETCTLRKKSREGLLIIRKIKTVPSEEARGRMSIAAKKRAIERPELNPWRRDGHLKSPPCEFLKKIFRESGLVFIEEYVPLTDRAFSLDIAFPEKKIGVEVNGNQHYDKTTGLLAPYYKERHYLIEGAGWRLVELHFSMVYDKGFIGGLINDLKNDGVTVEIDPLMYEESRLKRLEQFPKRTKVDILCLSCGSIMRWKSKSGLCIKCSNDHKRKVRPSKEELEVLVKELPMTKIGERYGVSGNAIRKWCRSYGIILVSKYHQAIYCVCRKRIKWTNKTGKCKNCLINEKRPSREILVADLEALSVRKVAGKYGVDRGLVKKWCRDLSIEP